MGKSTRFEWGNSLGQTAIEYILLLAVLVTIFIGLSSRIKLYYMGKGPCPNGSLVCRILERYQGAGYFDQSNRYRWFSLRRFRP